MDLDKLFTVTDYKLKPVDITTASSATTVNVWCSSQATTDYYLTGQILWPVSVLVSHYVAHLASQDTLNGKTIVELGAGGTGLPSLLAARSSSKRVVATDGNADVVLELLEKNVNYFNDQAHDEASSCQLSAHQLVWGDGNQLRKLLDKVQSVDVCVAADVVQWQAVVEPLLHTVKALLWTSTRLDPVFILGIVNRASSTYDLFFKLATELGFVARRVCVDDFLVDGLVPTTCQEFGGRETEIFELVLLKDRCSPPILLSANGETFNMTTGSGFEHTTSLPC